MDYKQIEKKWQKRWLEQDAHTYRGEHPDKKYFIMDMLPYPSGSALHLGHWYNYAPTDSFARFKKMQGYEIFQPMGFDAFGLPAENFAIKTGIHPKDSTYKNIETMRRQLSEMGAMFDWNGSLITCDPSYYKWTQWIFLQLFKKGLAYRKEASVNWCTGCNTVIANEQVVDGVCERCGSTVVRKSMKQWFFRITAYAEELLKDLDGLDWPEKTKLMQKNWIGKSTGGEVVFTTDDGTEIPVFTTRADTLFGVTYVVLAPEHPLVAKLTTPEHADEIKAYQEFTARQDDIERLSTAKEKTGAWTGSYCTNPINGKRVPILIADYVLASYGSGAVMGVAAHDARDYDFAVKYNLPIERVVNDPNGANTDADLPFCDYGVMTNSGEFDGMTTEEGRIAVVEKLAKMGKGSLKTNYRLRDWSVSRQRFWGCPIPIITCEHCGDVAVPEDQLPVELPYDVNFTPDGKSPLSKHEGYMNTVCPICGRPARRDPDTLDTFVCSSWYFLRYADSKNDKEAFNRDVINRMLPVDKYVGGAEHACMHLLYARFFTKALRDCGLLDFDEPFKSLVHQGLVLGPDGYKMSKSRGNVVNPDTLVDAYGSDVLRLYLMFGFNFVEGGPWSDSGLKSMARFVDKVERLVDKVKDVAPDATSSDSAINELDFVLNSTIKAVTRDFEAFSFNTALARVMEAVNAITKYDGSQGAKAGVLRRAVDTLVSILAPFIPHVAEEFHEILGGKTSIFNTPYPVCDESKLKRAETEYAVQLNAKVKFRVKLPTDATREQIEEAVMAMDETKALLNGFAVVKVIVIPGRNVNIVVRPA